VNRAQEAALIALQPEGHCAAEARRSPVARQAACSCGWSQRFPVRGRNGLGVTSQIAAAIRKHYIEAAARG
jgi:hypothetical protein